MPTYRVIDFMKTNNINLSGDYPDEEHVEFLMNFKEETFEFGEEIKSLEIELLRPSKNRVANVALLQDTSQEVVSLQNQGKRPEPQGFLEFTLWSDGRKTIQEGF